MGVKSFYVSTFGTAKAKESEVYSKKENVGILTALLVEHGVRHAVVCSGSRNAPIVHNLQACGSIRCHPVTDERSAAFFAMGIAQADGSPVVVCVTSGTALLNLLPAVAEASYQHLPLVVVAGDLPEAMQGQLDGQNIPQADALGRFVGISVTIGEPRTDEERWLVGRRVSEALCVCCGSVPRPVLINVPLSEPLFDFGEERLPMVSPIRVYADRAIAPLHADWVERFAEARRPMIVFGQCAPQQSGADELEALRSYAVVLSEATSAVVRPCPFDEVLADESKWEALAPDFVLHVGDDIVSKRIKTLVRQAPEVEVWRLSPEAAIADTFMRLRGVLVGDVWETLRYLDRALRHRLSFRPNEEARQFRSEWEKELTAAMSEAEERPIEFGSEAAVRLLHEELESREEQGEESGVVLHYANSTPIRLANTYSRQFVYCNRGVSGIDGSVSTAAGFSLVSFRRVVCVTGDLSFFYDSNALWNGELRGNLRILLLNNGRGGIFGRLPGLPSSPAYETLVAARHDATARGLCEAYCAEYASVRDLDSLRRGILRLLDYGGSRPMVLEVMLDR